MNKAFFIFLIGLSALAVVYCQQYQDECKGDLPEGTSCTCYSGNTGKCLNGACNCVKSVISRRSLDSVKVRRRRAPGDCWRASDCGSMCFCGKSMWSSTGSCCCIWHSCWSG